MKLRSRQEWIEAIEAKLAEFADGILTVDNHTRRTLATMSRKQLAAVEHLIWSCYEVSCATGCGECESCRAQNKRAAIRSKAKR